MTAARVEPRAGGFTHAATAAVGFGFLGIFPKLAASMLQLAAIRRVGSATTALVTCLEIVTAPRALPRDRLCEPLRRDGR